MGFERKEVLPFIVFAVFILPLYFILSLSFSTETVSAETITSNKIITPPETGLQSSQPNLDTSSFGNKNVWEYKYTAQPYAFFYNTLTGQWKMLQVTSYTQHTINVMYNGWSQTINRWATGQYLR